jgi:hypothetical protein
MTDAPGLLTTPNKGIRTAFWCVFFLIPLFSGVLQFRSLPNQYSKERHELLASHRACETNAAGMQQNCADTADAWRDRETGERFTRQDLAGSRLMEAARVSTIAFGYGLIGCFAFGYFRRGEDEDAFYRNFGKAVCANIAVVAYCFFMLAF